MRIILDTEKGTITVPYNFAEKLAEYNAKGHEFAGDSFKDRSWNEYLREAWEKCLADSDKRVKTGVKPVGKKKA